MASGRSTTARQAGPGETGDLVAQDEDGWLHFEGRDDDVIISSGYRIGPFEVESALVAHPAVAEAAAVAAPDEERGSVVRAVVVLRDDGYAPSPELVRELQEHVKRETAPYKYPRIVEFAAELPKTRQRQGQASRAARAALATRRPGDRAAIAAARSGSSGAAGSRPLTERTHAPARARTPRPPAARCPSAGAVRAGRRGCRPRRTRPRRRRPGGSRRSARWPCRGRSR